MEGESEKKRCEGGVKNGKKESKEIERELIEQIKKIDKREVA
jgi:hypothetical protein